jgi:hypothetical protein
LICFHSVLFQHSIISGRITTELVPVFYLCAYLCLAAVQQEPFPLASFTPFAGCNSLSAFTADVKDYVAMCLGVLVLHEPSPLGGAARGRFTTDPIIE